MTILFFILLGLITTIQLYRAWMVFSPTSKKKHFSDKLKGTQRLRWDLEFKVAKTMQIREDIRKEYDFMNSRIATLEMQLKGNPNDKDKLEDQKTVAEKDRDRLLNQIKALDLEANGCTKSKEYPDGYTGIKQQIESMREVEGMLKNHKL